MRKISMGNYVGRFEYTDGSSVNNNYDCGGYFLHYLAFLFKMISEKIYCLSMDRFIQMRNSIVQIKFKIVQIKFKIYVISYDCDDSSFDYMYFLDNIVDSLLISSMKRFILVIYQ